MLEAKVNHLEKEISEVKTQVRENTMKISEVKETQTEQRVYVKQIFELIAELKVMIKDRDENFNKNHDIRKDFMWANLIKFILGGTIFAIVAMLGYLVNHFIGGIK